MSRPGFVLEVDRSTPPILFHHGESFRLEKLPAGRSRVIFLGEPLGYTLLIGGAFVVCGIYLVNRQTRSKKGTGTRPG